VLPSDLIFIPNFVKISPLVQVLKWGIAAECVTVWKVHDFPLSRKEESRLQREPSLRFAMKTFTFHTLEEKCVLLFPVSFRFRFSSFCFRGISSFLKWKQLPGKLTSSPRGLEFVLNILDRGWCGTSQHVGDAIGPDLHFQVDLKIDSTWKSEPRGQGERPDGGTSRYTQVTVNVGLDIGEVRTFSTDKYEHYGCSLVW